MPPSRPLPIHDLRDAVGRTTSLDDLRLFLGTVRDTYGIDHAFYHWVNAPGGELILGTLPDDWTDRYLLRENPGLDPLIAACRDSFWPVDWKTIDGAGTTLRDFIQGALAAGISRQGFSCPVFGPRGEFSVFSVNHDCDDNEWSDFAAAQGDGLALLSRAVHAAARTILDDGREDLRSLTPRESQVVGMIARGHSRAEAAQRLDISEHTLRTHLESAREKLNAQNTAHVVARAMETGQIAR